MFIEPLIECQRREKDVFFERTKTDLSQESCTVLRIALLRLIIDIRDPKPSRVSIRPIKAQISFKPDGAHEENGWNTHHSKLSSKLHPKYARTSTPS